MQRRVIHWLPSSELQDARSLCLKTRPNAKQISIIMQSKPFFPQGNFCMWPRFEIEAV